MPREKSTTSKNKIFAVRFNDKDPFDMVILDKFADLGKGKIAGFIRKSLYTQITQTVVPTAGVLLTPAVETVTSVNREKEKEISKKMDAMIDAF